MSKTKQKDNAFQAVMVKKIYTRRSCNTSPPLANYFSKLLQDSLHIWKIAWGIWTHVTCFAQNLWILWNWKDSSILYHVTEETIWGRCLGKRTKSKPKYGDVFALGTLKCFGLFFQRYLKPSPFCKVSWL